MVQLAASVIVTLLLLAPSLAIPITHQQDFDARGEDLAYFEDLASRDPNFFGSVFKKIKKVVNPTNIGRVAKVASLIIRDKDAELSERDLIDLEELVVRDPNFFGSVFKKIKKVVNPTNIGRVARVASLVIRDEDAELSERDLEVLEELAARDPSFGSIFRKIKKVVNPTNIGRVAKVASLVIRDDGKTDLVERDFNDEGTYDRELEVIDLDELAARNPSFGSIFRKIKKVVNVKNIAKVASLVIRDEDLSERDLDQLEELAARDPSFGSIFRKIKKVVNVKNIGKVAKVASMVIRDDNVLLERDYSDFELEELD